MGADGQAFPPGGGADSWHTPEAKVRSGWKPGGCGGGPPQGLTTRPQAERLAVAALRAMDAPTEAAQLFGKGAKELLTRAVKATAAVVLIPTVGEP